MIQTDKEQVKCIYVVPFYDNDIGQLVDTVDSILYYTRHKIKIICVNDCKKDEHKEIIADKFKQEEIISFMPEYDYSWPRNNFGSLFYKLYQAIEYSVNKFQFDYLIKLDTDALLTGSKLLDFVDAYFSEKKSNVGLLGSYRIRSDGERRTHWEWGLYMIYLAYFTKKLSKYSQLWSNCLPKARLNGYSLGDHVLGGAHISKYNCLEKMINLFPYDSLLKDQLFQTNIGEDIIFSLLVFASGFQIDDFGRPGDPMAIAQKNLPLEKESIVKREKQIIHSVKKGLNGENEEEIRAYFRKIRI